MSSANSNEIIIEDLTKDLQNSSIESATAQNEDSSSSSPKHETNAEDEADIIDETSLQDRDALLSDEEKQNYLKEALTRKDQGNKEFAEKNYLESILRYSEGLRLCPLTYTNDRSVLYSNRGASKHKLGRKESAIQDCTKAIELNSNYVKAYLRRATLYEETEKLDEALEDYKKILEMDPGNKDAVAASVRLPPLINEKNEKLKAEMLDKLKDIGNMVLRPFGLSTNNFKMTQDPNSGGYSINFVQKP